MRRATLLVAVVLLALVPVASAATSAAEKQPARTTAATQENQPLGKGFKDAYGKEQQRSGKKPGSGSGSDEGSSSGGSGMRIILGLVLVLGLIYAIHWLLKKYAAGRQVGVTAGGSLDAIEVMATTSLAPTRSLHLVRVGNELVLIGATDQSINQLGRVDGQQLAVVAGNSGDQLFQQQLQGALTGTSMSQSATSDSTFLRKFVNNLQMMTAR